MRGIRPGLLLAPSLLIIAAAYSNALDVSFMWDDHTLIVNNPAAHQLTPLSAFFGRSFWAHPFSEGTSQGYFRPLVALSFAVDWAMGAGSPVTFHLTNVLAHVLACGLVFAVAMRLGATALAAVVVTLGFGLFPRLTESVTWVVGRTDVLAAMFGLLALWLELKAEGQWRRRLAVGLVLLLGLLCKEVVISVFVIIAAQSVARVRQRKTHWRTEALAGAPLLVALGLFMILRASSGTTTRAMQLNEATSMLNQLGHLTFLGLTPWFPNAQYGFVRANDLWAIALGVIFLIASAWLISRRHWLWWGVVVSMLSVTMPNLGYLTVTSDRFLYLPVALASCLLAPQVTSLRLLAGLGALALSFAPVTWLRNREWSNPIQFWRHTVEQAAPENLGPRNGYADALLDAHRVDEALAEFQALQRLNPHALRDAIDLGVAVCLSIRGDDELALRALSALDSKRKRVAFDKPLFLARALDFDGAQAALAALSGRFGRDEPLTQLEAVIRQGSEGWVAAKTPLMRGKVFDELGALGHAQREYEAVLSTETSTREDRLAALAWLVIKGPLPRADAALHQLEGVGASSDTIEGLRAILDDRR